jgi:Bacterial capsule synthesis protein PGA_cap
MDKTFYFKAEHIIPSVRQFLICFTATIILNGCSNDSKNEIRILFTGDILLSRNVKKEIEQKKVNPWKSIEERLKSEDLVIGNLEGTVGIPNASVTKASAEMVFDIPETYLILLKEAGFSALSIENNHSCDLGQNNKDTTIFKIQNDGMTPISFDCSPWFFNIKGKVISVLALNLIPNKEGNNQEIPSVDILQKLRLARELSDFVIVSIHWGNELQDWPSKVQRGSAEWLVENGADLIIGHHPHVIQAPEMIKGKPVFFSLGNHLFDQKYSDSKEGLMVECIIRNNSVKYRSLITHTVQNSFFPEIVKEYDLPFSKRIIKGAPLFSGISIKPESRLDSLNYHISLVGYLGNKKLWHTPSISLVHIIQAEFDDKHNYILTIEKHYSSIDGETALRPYVYDLSKFGLKALWRGSALSRPLIDATLSPNKKYLISLHRGDSYINYNPKNVSNGIELYKWNGFGFSGYKNDTLMEYALKYYYFLQ